MSKFSRFMKENKKEKKNGCYAPTVSLTDENGKPLEWEFRHITSKENEKLRDECMIDVQVTGKPNVYRPKLDLTKYLAKMITASTVTPDLYNAEAARVKRSESCSRHCLPRNLSPVRSTVRKNT